MLVPHAAAGTPHAAVHVYMYMCSYLYVYAYIDIDVFLYLYICVRIYLSLHIYIYTPRAYTSIHAMEGSPCSSVKQFSGAAGRDHPNSEIQPALGMGWHGSRNGLARNESSPRWPAAHLGALRVDASPQMRGAYVGPYCPAYDRV